MILLIDNYDSFVYSLARYVGRLGYARDVVRNDAIGIDDIERLGPRGIILSPGPCGPDEAGICNDVIRHFSGTIPILGVCLGHQCMGAVFGGKVTRAPHPVHGKADMITHDNSALFTGLPSRMNVARYHSLIVADIDETALRVTARNDDGIIMAMEHRTHPTYGVQFHPESVLTPDGLGIMENFLRITAQGIKAA